MLCKRVSMTFPDYEEHFPEIITETSEELNLFFEEI